MAKVTAIQLEVNGQVLTLKPKEARELMEVLKALLEPPPEVRYVPGPVIVERPVVHPWPYTYWQVSERINTAGVYALSNGVTVE